MQTNTVQLHKKIKYLLDQSNSPRFRTDQISEAINDAISIVMMNRFKPESPQDPNAGFQRNRILRDELRPLVKKISTSFRDFRIMTTDSGGWFQIKTRNYYKVVTFDGTDTVAKDRLIATGAPVNESGDVILNLEYKAIQPREVKSVQPLQIAESIPLIDFDVETNTLLANSFPADYNYLSMLRITVNGIVADPFEITYEQVATVMQDPYSRPSIDMPPRTYHFESNDGYQFITGDRGIITEVEMYYLSKPVKVFYGKEKTFAPVPAGSRVILGQERVLLKNGANAYGEFGYGDYIITPANPSPQTTVVVTDTINSDMPESLVREIVSEAAKILLVTVENFNKAAQTK